MASLVQNNFPVTLPFSGNSFCRGGSRLNLLTQGIPAVLTGAGPGQKSRFSTQPTFLGQYGPRLSVYTEIPGNFPTIFPIQFLKRYLLVMQKNNILKCLLFKNTGRFFLAIKQVFLQTFSPPVGGHLKYTT